MYVRAGEINSVIKKWERTGYKCLRSSLTTLFNHDIPD